MSVSPASFLRSPSVPQGSPKPPLHGILNGLQVGKDDNIAQVQELLRKDQGMLPKERSFSPLATLRIQERLAELAARASKSQERLVPATSPEKTAEPDFEYIENARVRAAAVRLQAQQGSLGDVETVRQWLHANWRLIPPEKMQQLRNSLHAALGRSQKGASGASVANPSPVVQDLGLTTGDDADLVFCYDSSSPAFYGN
jgi:hypothetical protein